MLQAFSKGMHNVLENFQNKTQGYKDIPSLFSKSILSHTEPSSLVTELALEPRELGYP